MKYFHLLSLVCIVIFFSSPSSSSARFDDQFQPSWALDHISKEGDTVKLRLDSSSGAGIASKSKYFYGKTTAEMKLVPGDSAGTVTAFYMSSDGAAHNEFDFEFLGNTSGEPYLVQTNVYVDGVGNREQRMDLWFDPTLDFHNYSILWNRKRVMFAVDDTPIRVYENREGEGEGLVYPKGQPMGIYSSIWNADDWATQGGRVKTDWSHQPFVTAFREVKMEGCEVVEGKEVEEEVKRCGESWEGKEGRYWWKEKEMMEELSVHQSHQLVWVRAKHLVYDYCFDSARFPAVPPECKR